MQTPEEFFASRGTVQRFTSDAVAPMPVNDSGQPPTKLHWHTETRPSLENRWHIKGVTPETGLAILGGAWGTGKSFTALELCRCTMTGDPFAGHRIKRAGGVLWLAAEAGGEMAARLEALRTDGRLPKGGSLPFAWTTEVPTLVKEGSLDALVGLVGDAESEMRARFDVPLVLVVVDTLMAAAGFQDENSSAEAQKALGPLAAIAQRFGLLVLVVDHYGHDTSKGLRGSTNKPAFADAILGINAKRAEDGTVSDRMLTRIKVRGGREGNLSRMELRAVELGTDSDGDAITSMVVDFLPSETLQPKAARRRTAPSAALFFSCLDVALGEHGAPFRIPDGPEVQAVNIERVRAEYYARRPDAKPDTRQKAFQRFIDSAAHRQDVGYAKTPAGGVLWPL